LMSEKISYSNTDIPVLYFFIQGVVVADIGKAMCIAQRAIEARCKSDTSRGNNADIYFLQCISIAGAENVLPDIHRRGQAPACKEPGLRRRGFVDELKRQLQVSDIVPESIVIPYFTKPFKS